MTKTEVIEMLIRCIKKDRIGMAQGTIGSHTLISALESEVDKPERWRPTDRYFFIGSNGRTYSCIWQEDASDSENEYFGNCFPSREAAEAARDKVKELLQSL